MSPRKPRIVVYGGSFDPPHVGHAALLYAAMANSWIEKAYVVPTFQHVLKGGHYSDVRDRLAMLTLNFSTEVPFNIEISDLEAKANRPMYTWEVLDHFKAQHKDRDIVFLAGDDILEQFQHWDRADYLAKAYEFMIGPRGSPPVGGMGLLLPRIEIVPIRRPYAISSTDIREKLLDGKSTAGLLHPMVHDYIAEHALYRATERVEEGSTK